MTSQREIIGKCRNLVEVIAANREPNKGITFIHSEENELFLSYSALYERALELLCPLQERGVKPGDELVFQLSDNFHFIAVFWACILGGIIPVPITIAYNDRYRTKLFNIWKDLYRPRMIISKIDFEKMKLFTQETHQTGDWAMVEKDTLFIEDLEKCDGKGKIHDPRESDLAFIQFSSGSTSQSKGVMLTHKNLLTNVRDIIKACQWLDSEERVLSWMPLTHDMGLIGMHIVPTIAHWDMFLMSTRTFTLRPRLWLKKLSDHRITVTSSPNFGYKHVLRFFDPSSLKGLDLANIHTILNGAEPISADLCREFLDTLAGYGLGRTSIRPCYGMAEASLAVSFSGPKDEIIEYAISRGALGWGQEIVEKGPEEKRTTSEKDFIRFVDVGWPTEHCSVRIVDREGRELKDRFIGEIQIRGDNVTAGYYNNREASEKIITADGWIHTGDMGFSRDGRLVITGRVKDTIYVHGNTYYAHDIESTCEEVDGLKETRIAACGVPDPRSQSEDIICFVEFKKKLTDFIPLANALRKQILKGAGVAVTHFIPIPRIPFTTSGKKQRYQLKERYLSGEFDASIVEISRLQKAGPAGISTGEDRENVAVISK